MNVMRIATITTLLLALATVGAEAPPADTAPDYSKFAKFITDRNIFNPDRYPHASGNRSRKRKAPQSAPSFSLVGTMEYQKGTFAFFDGNNSDYRKILGRNEEIAGYSIREITLTGVELKAPGTSAGTNLIEMTIGSEMRQEDGKWELSGVTHPLESSAGTESGAEAAGDAGADTNAPAASGSGEPVNDVLKKLMEKREQEMK
jgi:hypothetical protein